MKKYRTILIDPPWEYPEGFPSQSRTPGKWSGPVINKPLPYASMSLDEIYNLPVASLADKDCRLFLWVTNKYMEHFPMVIKSYFFTYKQIYVSTRNISSEWLLQE